MTLLGLVFATFALLAGTVIRHGSRVEEEDQLQLEARRSVTGSVSMQNGARRYDHTNIRTIIKNPVNFGSFLTSLVDIQRAAQAGGIYLNNTSVNGWRLTFQPNGTVDVQQCTRYSGRALAAATPTCVAASPANRPVPSNGAIYSAQPVIVSGQVKGRVTVAANDDVIVADNISYVQTGSDVLGLVAASDVLVAQWAPNDLSWRAATIAQTGAWRSWSNDGSHGTDLRGLDGDEPRRLDDDVPDARLPVRRLARVPAAAVVPDARRRLHGRAPPRAAVTVNLRVPGTLKLCSLSRRATSSAAKPLERAGHRFVKVPGTLTLCSLP